MPHFNIRYRLKHVIAAQHPSSALEGASDALIRFMLAAGRQIGKKRRLCEAGSDYATLAITTSIQRSQLLRKWYDVLKGTYYNPVPNALTTGDEWVWNPQPSTPFQSQTANTIPDHPSIHSVGLWLPFLGGKRTSIDTGRRFFARVSTPQTHPLTVPKEEAIESWRHSQSEDTYDLDEKIVKLLSTESSRLPKPCDPLTYCFWKNGMRRQFEPISSAANTYSHSSRNSVGFSVCSYNVLCQRTLNYYLEQLYSHCPFEHLTWQRRWPLLAVELQMLDADVFCLQEVEYDHFELDYMPFLSKLGYDGAFKKKLGKKSDGCATFWRRDKFRVVHVHPVEYAFPPPHDHSDCVALLTVLEPVTRTGGSNGRVVVANTHLIYQPALGATKLCQAALLLAHLQKVTRQYTPFESSSLIPLILCGDFNSTPFSPLYSLLIKGQLQYEGLNGWDVSGQKTQPNSRLRRLNAVGDTILGPSLLPEGSPCSQICTLVDNTLHNEQESTADGCLSHSLNLRSVYDHTSKYGEKEATMFLRDQSVGVDYIFYSVEDKKIHKSAMSENGQSAWTTNNVRENGLRCLERYVLPQTSQLHRTIGYLPNQYCASDHLPLMAKFALDTR